MLLKQKKKYMNALYCGHWDFKYCTKIKRIEVKIVYITSGNTRVISQNALQNFQEEMAKVKKDPYKVVMKQTRLPISLLNETSKVCRLF